MANLYELRGKKASLNELMVGTALDRAGIDYLFQVSYWGGRTVRGGQVLDFLVFTPFELPLQVFGEYWHEGQLGSKDKLKLALLEQFFGRDIVVIWSNESMTVEDATAALRREKVIL